MVPGRFQGLLCPCRLRCPGKPGPRLGQGIDPRLCIGSRAEQAAIIKGPPQIPPAVPAVLFDPLGQDFSVLSIASAQFRLPEDVRQLAHSLQHITEEPGQPDTLSFPFGTHQVHAIVPIPGPDQRQAAGTGRLPPGHRPPAVLKEGGLFRGDRW